MNNAVLQQLTVLPGLVVPIGGSGQRFSVHLNALMEERLGVASVPLVEKLVIDVVREFQQIPQGEFLQLSVRGLERAIGRYPWSQVLKEYELVQKLPNLERGCGGIPLLGRLAFAIHRPVIRHALCQKARAVASRMALRRAAQAGANAQRRLQVPVWILTSFYGATGAGMCFDLAALCKEKLDVETEVNLVCFTPGCFSHISEEDQPRGKGVGYAMFRQLNHYRKGNEFFARYDNGEEIRAKGFIDQVYLIDGISEWGVALKGEEDPFRIAAEFLYAVLFTGLGVQLQAGLLNPGLTHPGVRAFGVHKIVHPVRTLARWEKLERAREGIEKVRLNSNGHVRESLEVQTKEVQR